MADNVLPFRRPVARTALQDDPSASFVFEPSELSFEDNRDDLARQDPVTPLVGGFLKVDEVGFDFPGLARPNAKVIC